MSPRDRAIGIIASLKLKTVKNGATPDEAASAVAKILELRTRYDIAKPAPIYFGDKVLQPPDSPPPKRDKPRPAPPSNLSKPYVFTKEVGGNPIGCQWFVLGVSVADMEIALGYPLLGTTHKFKVNGTVKCWVYSYENSHIHGKWYLHGPIEVFQSMFNKPIFKA